MYEYAWEKASIDAYYIGPSDAEKLYWDECIPLERPGDAIEVSKLPVDSSKALYLVVERH